MSKDEIKVLDGRKEDYNRALERVFIKKKDSSLEIW